jgi:hypothetical protein
LSEEAVAAPFERIPNKHWTSLANSTGSAALAQLARLFQNDGDTKLLAHAPDRFDRAFGDLTMCTFEFFYATGSHDHRFEAEDACSRCNLFHLSVTWKRLGLNRYKTDLC